MGPKLTPLDALAVARLSMRASVPGTAASQLGCAHALAGPEPKSAESNEIVQQIVAVLAAFRTNAIDADISVTSNIFNWEEKKEGRLLIPVSNYVGNIAAGAIYATQHLIATDPDALRGFLAAWLETIDYISTHKAETVKIESEVTGYSESVMAKEYDVTRGMFSKDCKFDADSIANLRRAFIDQKLVESPPDMSKLYTEAFLPK